MKNTTKFFTTDLYIKTQIAKSITLLSAGFTYAQIEKITEYEFTVQQGITKYLEIWSNTQRTNGYRKIETPKNLSNIFSDYVV